MSKNNYNILAPIYDFITNLVFRGKVLKAQKEILSILPQSGNLLFIGGGTGKTLKAIEQLRPQLSITYIDPSSEMIRSSKKQSTLKTTRFIQGTEKDIPNEKFDVVCTFFFLDLFNALELKEVFNKLNSHLNEEGLWLYADFNVAQNWWQKGIEFAMFQFLKLTTNITTNRIEDYSKHFRPGYFDLQSKNNYFGNYISNAVYKKRETE